MDFCKASIYIYILRGGRVSVEVGSMPPPVYPVYLVL